ncbi:hypothetical protein JCM8097_008205 [Rhodosporidiobolus ruineniae]
MARYEPLKHVDDDYELGGAGGPRRADWTSGGGATLRWLKQYGGWVVAGLFVLNALRGSSGSSRKTDCWDPYNALGYVYRPSNGSIRWIPYPPTSPSFSLSRSTEIESTLEPPPEALSYAPAPYGDMLHRLDSEDGLKAMEWARGKTIAFIGDSHDRFNVEYFCHQHSSAGAKLSVPHYHIKAHCRIPALDLTLVSWFHYGLAPESDSLPPSSASLDPPSDSDTSPSPTVGWNIPSLPTSHVNENPAPYAVEGRLREYWLPDTQTSKDEGGLGGKPDLIVLNSFFWDLRYFALHAKHFRRPEALFAEERPLTYSELAWHRQRVREYIELVRSAFPDVPIMFRLGQQKSSNRNEGNVAVFQLNESIRAVLRELDVPVFEWARLITGESHYNDDQHLKQGAPARLFGDMALFYLRKAVEGRWGVCEKPPR